MTDTLLVIRPGAIGDALLAIPAIAALRAAFPDNCLSTIAHPAVAELLYDEGLVDRFISRDAPEADALFAPTALLARERFDRVDSVLAWSGDPDGCLARNLAALRPRRLVVAPSRPPDGCGKHVAQYLLDTLAPLGVRARATDWPGFGRHRAVVDGQTRPASTLKRVVIHPGSGSQHKNWPTEFHAAVAERLVREAGAAVTVLVGPADDSLLHAFDHQASFRYTALVGRSLRELAVLLAGCDLYLGNDSGISHLAGMCGAASVVLFGPTDPRLWRPLGQRVTVLWGQPLAALSVDSVAESALELLSQPRGGLATPYG